MFDADGDLALIDPRELVLERERKGEKEKEKEGRTWPRFEGRLQRELEADT